ncbi:MAG: hypothetical protein PVI81_03420 [Anaerolineales bacterium]|jgi:hypothetical protein
MVEGKRRASIWFTRVSVAVVFAMNLSAALGYLFLPMRFASGYELQGEVGRIVVQGFGILYLMWNATYPLVIWNPVRHRIVFIIVLIQQLIALVGESLLIASVPAEFGALIRTGARFILFDGAGLLLMAAGFLMVRGVGRPHLSNHDARGLTH